MIVDTGVLYAAMAPRDRHHAACAKLLRATRELLLPAPVLVELDYLLSQLTRSSRPFDEVLRRIENGVFTVLDLAAQDYSRVRDLCTQYGDWPLGFVDAAVSRWPSGSVRPGSRRSTVAISPRSSPGVSRRSNRSRNNAFASTRSVRPLNFDEHDSTLGWSPQGWLSLRVRTGRRPGCLHHGLELGRTGSTRILDDGDGPALLANPTRVDRSRRRALLELFDGGYEPWEVAAFFGPQPPPALQNREGHPLAHCTATYEVPDDEIEKAWSRLPPSWRTTGRTNWSLSSGSATVSRSSAGRSSGSRAN